MNILLHPWILFTTFFTLGRVYYLINLLRSAGFLALLGPEWLLPTLFSLAINLLSMEIFEYSGVYQYNAAIIPFIMIAAIHGSRRFTLLWYSWRGELKKLELLRAAGVLTVSAHHTFDVEQAHAIAILTTIVQILQRHFESVRVIIIKRAIVKHTLAKLSTSLIQLLESFHARGTDLARWLPVPLFQSCYLLWIVGMIALNYFIMLPWFNIFWAKHQLGNREQHIAQLLAIIPPDAPVSAGGNINPHLTERQYVTVFPELTIATMTIGRSMPAQYVVIDLYNVSPEDQSKSAIFLNTFNWLERSQQFRILGQAEGVILLKRVS